MTADTLLADLRSKGVTVVPDGAHLRCRPKSALTSEDLEALRTQKAEVLAALRQEAAGPKIVCYACKTSRFWRSIYGNVICGICHPPASPKVVADWISAPEADVD